MAQANPFNAFAAFSVKETGQFLIRCSHKLVSERRMFPVLRHSNLKVYQNVYPEVDHHAFVAPNACLTGNITVASGASVFYYSTWRNYHTEAGASLGAHSTILERVSLLGRCQIGANVVVGPGSTLDCCEVHDGVIIGAGCTIAHGAVLETGCILAPGTVVDADVRVPAGELWAGNPGTKVADVSHHQRHDADHYIHEMAHLGHRHEHEYAYHLKAHEKLDYTWLMKCCDEVEKRKKLLVPFKQSMDVPPEAKQFLTPRVAARITSGNSFLRSTGHKTGGHMAPWLVANDFKMEGTE